MYPLVSASPHGGGGFSSPSHDRRYWRWASLWIAVLAALALAFAGLTPAHAADLKFPQLTGRVVDDAHVLSDVQKAALTDKLKALEDKTSRQLVVVTVPSLQGDDIQDYGYKLGRAWGIGQKAENNGTLLIVAPTEHQVRIEVGYGMEGILTDALTSVILQTQVLPKFKAGDVPGGIEAGTDALIQQMSADPSEAEQKVAAAKAQQDAATEGGYHYVHHRSNPLSAIFAILFVLFVFGGVFGRRGGLGGLLPLLFLGSLGGGGRDDDWGGGGGGSGGGGGFSGGGGGFGGGGSSGSW